MKALVTGCCGYIGKILCLKLAEQGWDVIGQDTSDKADRIGEISPFLTGYDVSTPEGYGNVEFLNNNLDINVIFHLGADSLLAPSVYDPLKYFENNVSNMQKMLSGIINSGVNIPIVFASSAAVYGNPVERLCEIGDPTVPINPYGMTKLIGEQMLETSCKAYGARAMAMRFFNVAGAYKQFGQDLDQPHILTKMSLASIKNEQFVINGHDYPTPDKTCIRDYIHVEEVVDNLIRYSESLVVAPQHYFDIFNFGSGINAYSNLELAYTFNQYHKLNFNISTNKREGDPAILQSAYPIRTKKGIQEIINSQYEYVANKLGQV
jgi:UDP-glucose 4-epimerase